jgi:cobalamin biosynthesis Mg chelatase CobN
MHADNDEAWKEAVRLSAEQEETAEYKAWEEENEKLFTKVESLLQEFYKERNVSDELRIIADRSVGGFRVHGGGKFYIPNNQKERLQSELTDAERKRIPEVLMSSQEEMKAFTEFLQNKYFEAK